MAGAGGPDLSLLHQSQPRALSVASIFTTGSVGIQLKPAHLLFGSTTAPMASSCGLLPTLSSRGMVHRSSGSLDYEAPDGSDVSQASAGSWVPAWVSAWLASTIWGSGRLQVGG